MIMAQQVQEPVYDQAGELRFGIIVKTRRLRPGPLEGNDHVSDVPIFIGQRKRQYIRRSIHIAKTDVQIANAHIIGEDDRDRAIGHTFGLQHVTGEAFNARWLEAAGVRGPL